jgi:hypothetical protein
MSHEQKSFLVVHFDHNRTVYDVQHGLLLQCIELRWSRDITGHDTEDEGPIARQPWIQFQISLEVCDQSGIETFQNGRSLREKCACT